jgi:hypothetical protein
MRARPEDMVIGAWVLGYPKPDGGPARANAGAAGPPAPGRLTPAAIRANLRPAFRASRVLAGMAVLLAGAAVAVEWGQAALPPAQAPVREPIPVAAAPVPPAPVAAAPVPPKPQPVTEQAAELARERLARRQAEAALQQMVAVLARVEEDEQKAEGEAETLRKELALERSARAAAERSALVAQGELTEERAARETSERTASELGRRLARERAARRAAERDARAAGKYFFQ